MKGKKNGKGKHIYSNNYNYQNDWIDSIKEGNGICIFLNRTIYLSKFKNNNINSKGKYMDIKIGNIYEEELVNSHYNGYGELFKIDVGRYKGYFKNNKKNGKGEMRLLDVKIYSGDYYEGIINRKDKLIFKD